MSPAARSMGPSGPHPFVRPDDSRLGLALSAAGTPGLQMGSRLALADASVRAPEARCALGGCGKLREDPIHRPVE
jgi:hypothetical protein